MLSRRSSSRAPHQARRVTALKGTRFGNVKCPKSNFDRSRSQDSLRSKPCRRPPQGRNHTNRSATTRTIYCTARCRISQQVRASRQDSEPKEMVAFFLHQWVKSDLDPMYCVSP